MMPKTTDIEAQFEQDVAADIHENAVKQLVQRIASHDTGIAECAKNSCDAYSEADTASENKIILIMLKNEDSNGPALFGCLDFVGMTTEKIEDRFKKWGDPFAATGGSERKAMGGHGHGGKAYMVNMFKDHALLITSYGGFGNRYGFQSGDIRPGYFPDRTKGRRFPVSSKESLLSDALKPFKVDWSEMPGEIHRAFAAGNGFTIVKGVNPKDLNRGRFSSASLLNDLGGHAQMIQVLQEAQVYFIVDGRPLKNGWPLTLEPIEPLEGGEEPRQFSIPDEVIDPNSGEKVSTTKDGNFKKGTLTLYTSKKSMAWNPPRHQIYIKAQDEHIGSWYVRDLVGKGMADHIYGYLVLDSLQEFKTSDRLEPAPSVLTRAIKEWCRVNIEAYGDEFLKREKLKTSQKERNEWQKISEAMNQWKNKFLKNVGLSVGKDAGSSGGANRANRLPKGTVARVTISLSHSHAGIGVAIRPSIEFQDSSGQRVRSIPYRLNSSDWNVATFDEDLFKIITNSPGETEIWAETLEGKIISNKADLHVLDIKRISMKEEVVEIPAGRFKPIGLEIEDRNGHKYDGAYLIWTADNVEVVRIGEAGVAWALATGHSEIVAGDDRIMTSPGTLVKVVEGVGSGDKKGSGFPQILLSGIDPDPFNPDAEPVQLSRKNPPVHQRVSPDDIGHQIWWINMAAPLAHRYWAEASGEALNSDKVRQWRVYYLERFIEALVKIRLYIEYRFEGNVSWDVLKDRWDDVMMEVQESMATELESFLDSGDLPKIS